MALITKPDMEFIWASGGAIVEPSDVKKQTGWTPEVPPHQWENWVQNRQDQYLAHINQRGIPEWDGNTEYEAGGLSYVQGTNGVVYKSVAASGPATTVQDPVVDGAGTYWTPLITNSTETQQGIIRIGTQGEVNGGLLNNVAVTPLKLKMADQPTLSGSYSSNGTTGNTIQMTGIVNTLSLELGDVIQITGSTGGLNDKLFTVESITNNNSIIVNYEHAGNRGNGSLKLADQTATVTITRIAKWYNAPIGLGQAWVNVKNFRALGTTHTNTTGRSIIVSMIVTGDGAGAEILVDGVRITVNDASGVTIGMSAHCSVPDGSQYELRAAGGTYSADHEMR